MATRLSTKAGKVTRVAGKKCPTCHMGSVEDLKAGQQALTGLIAKQRLRALAKARRVKARNAAKRRTGHASSEGIRHQAHD